MADPQVLTTLRRKRARDVGTEAFADRGQDRGLEPAPSQP